MASLELWSITYIDGSLAFAIYAARLMSNRIKVKKTLQYFDKRKVVYLNFLIGVFKRTLSIHVEF